MRHSVVGFITWKFVTMHGHMNVKNCDSSPAEHACLVDVTMCHRARGPPHITKAHSDFKTHPVIHRHIP